MMALIGLLAVVAVQINFDQAQVGGLPDGWAMVLTGRGGEVNWVVVEDSSAHGRRALAQLSKDQTDNRFPLAIYEKFSGKDVEIAVHAKAVAGEVDRAIGVVVRYQDAKNYYVARANALEDNVRFYRVKDGDREQIGSAEMKVSSGEWHTLSLWAEGRKFVVTFDGKEAVKAEDATFNEAGKVGLWTKADSVTEFDEVNVTVVDEKD